MLLESGDFLMPNKYKRKKIYSVISLCRRCMISSKDRGSRDSLLYWQQTIFVSLLLTILSLGFIASLSGAAQFIREGHPRMAIVMIFYYLIFFFIAFLKPVNYHLRILFLGMSLYIIGITLIISTGPYGGGLLYLCVSYVYFAINVSRTRGFLYSVFNAVFLLILSVFYQIGFLDEYRIREYGGIWWVILINLILVNVFITQIVGIILHGMERRFIKEKRANRTLRRISSENNKQIRLLKSLRQVGNCISDTRLELSERLHIMQKNLHEELPVHSSALILTDRDSDDSNYLISIPEDLTGEPFRIPRFSGPFLLMNNRDRDYRQSSTAMMRRMKDDQIYFGCHFYTTEQKGFLELLMEREPDSSELEYLQMNLFQLSGSITNEQLIRQLEDSRDILELSYDEILKAWAKILELRDIETKGHSHRVVDISLNLAKLLNLSSEEQLHLQRGAFLHDIGKLGIPDSILHKEGPLSTIEWDIMHKHPQMGKDSVKNIPFLKPAINVIYHHHEHWDGTGYPEGLKREAIPLSARIFTLADVFDALISDRPYRKALKEEDALAYMASQKGQIFDPELLNIFIRNISKIKTESSVEELISE